MRRPTAVSPDGRWTVSPAVGTRPLWARSGRELFYVSPTGAVMRVGGERGPSWLATKPTLVVKEGYRRAALGRGAEAPGGRRSDGCRQSPS
jgi:hypothetical protein